MHYILIAFLCFFVSCQKAEKKLNTPLYLNLAEDPQTLDPRQARSLRDLTLVKQLYDGLTRISPDGKPEPAIAEKIEISEDGLTYNFYLRKALWTNGSPVTAHDFENAWKSVLDPKFPSDYAHMLYPLKNGKEAKLGACSLDEVCVKALSDSHLQATLNHPTPYFLELTAFPTFFPFQEGCYNGPFILSAWQAETLLKFKKNPLYWEKEKVQLDEIDFTIITDDNTESLLYEKGELDWLGQPLSFNISSDHLSKLKAAGSIRSFLVAGTYWLKFNTKKAPFDDVRMRKALSYAIDRAQIVSYILQGNQVPATGILPPMMALNQFEKHENAHDLFLSYLEEKGSIPQIVLCYGASERNSKIVQFVKECWRKEFGIDVELQSIEMKSYRRELRKGDYMIGTGDWIADFNDPISFLDIFKFNDGRLNETGWENSTYTHLLDLAENECVIEKRSSYLKEAEKILRDEMVVAPIYHYSFDYVMQEGVQDVLLSPIGFADFKYAKKNKR